MDAAKRKVKNALATKQKDQGAVQLSPRTVGREPQLNDYVLTRALKRPDGISFTDLARALLDAKDRAGDKTARSQLGSVLLHLSFYEDLPTDIVPLLLPLFQSHAKDPRSLRSLFYTCGIFAGPGTAGTPTLIEPGLAGKKTEERIINAIANEARTMLETPKLDAAQRRAAFYLLATASRGSVEARRELLTQMQRAVNAADALANAANALGAVKTSSSASKRRLAAPATKSSQNDWDLQHSLFGASRMAGLPAAENEVAMVGAFAGVSSPDSVGARHAISLVADIAYRDASVAAGELAYALHDAADAYEAGVPTSKAPGQGINLEDPFARLHLARLCANVVHSDQISGEPGREGAPFWRMLCLLASRDTVDMVRFGALEAISGLVPSATAALTTTMPAKNKAAAVNREDAVQQQRRGRAWRALVSQASMPVTVPGVVSEQPAAPMKLIDVIGRLLVLALRKAESPARFTVAGNVVASLAESCLASQSTGTSRHNSSPDVDRIMNILASELDSLLEVPLPAALRSVCIQALLFMQAAGYRTALSPAKLSQLGGTKKGETAGAGVQDVLLAAVLKCARLKPKSAADFLGFASGIVGMAPAGLDLRKVTDLWDAAVAASKEGKEAALSAALSALDAPAPPCVRPGPAADESEIIRAAREDAGWSAFKCTALWWLGEHANELCGEFVGQKLTLASPNTTTTAAVSTTTSTPPTTTTEAAADGTNGTTTTSPTTEEATPTDVLKRHGSRNPALAHVISRLHTTITTSTWILRITAARALATIAVRSGEPYRLQCYGILSTAGHIGRDSDALGIQAVSGPVVALLDKVYASQIVLKELWEEYGDDVDGWPEEIVASVFRRNVELVMQTERLVCSLPKERYSLLGLTAVKVLAAASGDDSSYASLLGGAEEPTASERSKSTKIAGVDGNITATKNREIEDILSYGGSDSYADSGAFKLGGGGASESNVLGDRNREIESMLSAGSPTSRLWGGVAGGGDDGGGFSNAFNAFVEPPQPEEPAVASPTENKGFSWDIAGGGGGGATTSGGMYNDGYGGGDAVSSPPAQADDPWAAFDQPAFGTTATTTTTHRKDNANQRGTAKVLGTGTMVHTFIADSNNPEEISVFGGDRVEVLSESDGWMLIKDPSGLQGLVPTSYVQLEQLFNTGGTGGNGNSGVNGGFGDGVGSPGRADSSGSARHQRIGSIDYFSNKEDYLDRMFEGGSPSYSGGLPGMPENRAFKSGTTPPVSPPPFGGGGSSLPFNDARTATTGTASRTGYASPTWGRSISSAGGAISPPRALSPSRLGPSSSSDLLRQVSGGSAAGGVGGNPFNAVHRRVASGASIGSHHRTLSGSSDAFGGGAGSMPGTPSHIEGPERGVVAGFVAEMDGELSVEVGDKVKVHSETGGWARVIRLSDRKVGLVPAWAVGE